MIPDIIFDDPRIQLRLLKTPRLRFLSQISFQNDSEEKVGQMIQPDLCEVTPDEVGIQTGRSSTVRCVSGNNKYATAVEWADLPRLFTKPVVMLFRTRIPDPVRGD